LSEDFETVLEVSGEDKGDSVEFTVDTRQTKNRENFNVVFDKSSKRFTVIIGSETLEFNYLEFRDFVNVLSGWFESIENQFFREEAERLKKALKELED